MFIQRVFGVAFVERKHLEARELAVEAVAEVYGDVLTGLDDVRVDFRLGTRPMVVRRSSALPP